MLTIAHAGPYRFFFFASEGDEARHVHVQRGECLEKFWLDPVTLSTAVGYSVRELRRLQFLVEARRAEFTDAWDDFFRS